MHLWDLGGGRGHPLGPSYHVPAWPTNLYETPRRTHASRLSARAAALIARARSLRDESERNADWTVRLVGLAEEAAALDAELRASLSIADAVEPSLAPLRTLNPRPAPDETVPAPDSFPHRVSVFRTPAAALIALRTQALRITLLTRLRECQAAAAATPQGPPAALAAMDLDNAIRDASHALCDAVPSAMGEVDTDGRLMARPQSPAATSILVIWGLHVVATNVFLEEAHFRWVMRQLIRVGGKSGIRQGTLLERWHTERRKRIMETGRPPGLHATAGVDII